MRLRDLSVEDVQLDTGLLQGVGVLLAAAAERDSSIAIRRNDFESVRIFTGSRRILTLLPTSLCIVGIVRTVGKR